MEMLVDRMSEDCWETVPRGRRSQRTENPTFLRGLLKSEPPLCGSTTSSAGNSGGIAVLNHDKQLLGQRKQKQDVEGKQISIQGHFTSSSRQLWEGVY